MPASANAPPRLSGTVSTRSAQRPRRSLRSAQYSMPKVTVIASSEGSAKAAIHAPSVGMVPPYSTRLAGLEIGSTKLAALAISAQANSIGSGLAPALRAAAYTAGVSTTAVASLDRNAVTTMPTPNTTANKRRGEPLARFTACIATQSNRPSARAVSDSSIIPIRNR